MKRNRWNYELSILIFAQFKSSFFEGVTSINCFQIFKWIAREFLLHRAHGVHRQASIGVQINNLEHRGLVEITLIHCFFNFTTLKQRWTNVIFTPCFQGNCLETYQENIHNRVEGCNLSKITKFIFITLRLLWNKPKLPKSVTFPKCLWIDASTS